MEIKLKKLIIKNFKGIKDFAIEIKDLITNIIGENGSGKTTIIDAFYWVLFDKDSMGRTVFGIKPYNKKGEQIPHLVNEVTVEMEVDGIIHSFKKVMEEVRRAKRGTKEKVFEGHEIKYYHNGVPKKMSEFNSVISTLILEDVFKLITNPLYFNSLDWQKQAELLKRLITPVTQEEILSNIKDEALHNILLKILSSDRTFKEWRAANNEKIKKLTIEIEKIPIQINEVKLSKPEPQEWDVLQQQLSELEKEKSTVTDKMLEANQDSLQKSKAYKEQLDKVLAEQKEHNESIFQLKMKRNLEIGQLRSALNGNEELESSIRIKQNELQFKINELKSIKDLIAQITRKQEVLKSKKEVLLQEFDKVKTDTSEIDSINAEEFEFTIDTYKCPTCKRLNENIDLEAEKSNLIERFTKLKETRIAKIIENKKKRLEEINAEGVKMNSELKELAIQFEQNTSKLDLINSEIEIIHNEIESISSQIEENKKSAKTLDDLIAESETIRLIDEQLRVLESKKFDLPEGETVDNTTADKYRFEISQLDAKIKSVNSLLQLKAQIEKADKRIEELKSLESEQIATRAELENMEIAMDLYEKTDSLLTQSKVNEKFQFVRFSFLKSQINGGTKETCECSLDGVPFADLNTASKVKAGIDIINTFSQHYNRYAPIFIDNRESVQEIPPTASQIINLLVPTNVYAFSDAFDLKAVERIAS